MDNTGTGRSAVEQSRLEVIHSIAAPHVKRLRQGERTTRGTRRLVTQRRRGPDRRVDARRHHPAVTRFALQRAARVQLRIADRITAFAGSMTFVYIHAVVFAGWILFAEHAPWAVLTLIVSLEAIFLSTFVMIGQNRQAAFQEAKADSEFENEGRQLTEGLQLLREMHATVLPDPVPPGSGEAVQP